MATTKHTVTILALEAGSDPRDVGQHTFEGEDYHAFAEKEALQRILADKEAFGLSYDKDTECFVFNGHLIPRETFRGIEVRMFSKSRPPGEDPS